jgi:anti-sigma regulatory factor (Ser/Thr protein kinase)
MTPEETIASRRESDMSSVASAQVRCQLMAAMANIFETQVICDEVFPATRDQVAQVRKVIKEAISGEPALDTIVLLASELAANAVLHSGSSFLGLVIARTALGGLRVAVVDEGRKGLPCLRPQELEGESGRGMQLVDELAQRWGLIRQAGVGVVVWFDAR